MSSKFLSKKNYNKKQKQRITIIIIKMKNIPRQVIYENGKPKIK